jgi:hypothetical protein
MPVDKKTPPIGKVLLAIGLLLFILVGGAVGLAAGCKEYNRYQVRADASNQVKVTQIGIQNAEEQAKVVTAQIAATKAQAEQKYQEAIGIKRAQVEINKTLTPLYVQHEAIEAQLKMADSPNHTIIWAPSGSNGVPSVIDPITQSGQGG